MDPLRSLVDSNYTLVSILRQAGALTPRTMIEPRRPMDNRPGLCPLYHRAVELIGRRWTGAIVFVLLRGRCRYSDLRAAIPDLTDRMLSERLKELEHEGIVERRVIPETPVRVEYALTARGEALAQPVEALMKWAHEWLPEGADHGGTRDAPLSRG